MIIGLCGPTDLYCLRRTKLASAFCAKTFFFDDLTIEYCRKLPVLYRGKTYDELLALDDRAGLILMKQQVEDGLRQISPRLYTDWMGNQIATRAFPKGLKISSKVTEAVVGDVKYQDWWNWLKTFATDKHNRTNRFCTLVGIPELPSPLCNHPSELEYKAFATDFDFDLKDTDLARQVNRCRSFFYLNRSEE